MLNPYVEIPWASGTEKYSQIAIPFSDHQSKPLLFKKPQIKRRLNIDYGHENSTVQVELSNHDGYFSSKMKTADRFIIGKTIKIVDQGITLFTGAVCAYPTIENRFFKLKADSFSLMQTLANRILNRDEFPAMPPQNDGKPGNVIYGCPFGYFTAFRIEPNRYHAAWNPLTDITGYDKDKNPISATKTIDPVTNYTYIDYTSDDDYILFQAEESTTNPADQLNSLLTLFSDLEIENLAEAQTIYNGRSYAGCLFINNNSTYLDVFNEFSRNFSTRVIFTAEGKIRLKILKWGGEQPERLATYVIKDFTQSRETKYLKGQYIRMYQYNVGQKSFTMTPVIASSDMSKDVAELKQKYITLDVVSLDAAAREAFLRKEPLIIYQFQIPSNVVNLNIGDTYEIKSKYSDFPDSYRMMQILGIEKNDKTGFISVEGYDITGIQNSKFILRETEDPEAAILYEPGNPANPTIFFSE